MDGTQTAEKAKDAPENPKDVAKPKQYVTKEMLLGEVVAQYPKAAFVMLQYGLHCIGCHVSAYETIEQGCAGHGMPPHVMEEMIEDLNEFIADEASGKASGSPEQQRL